jgi:hypothetical protein
MPLMNSRDPVADYCYVEWEAKEGDPFEDVNFGRPMVRFKLRLLVNQTFGESQQPQLACNRREYRSDPLSSPIRT